MRSLLMPLFSCLILSVGSVLGQNVPFPKHQTYAAGTLRVTSHTQEQQDKDVRAAYNTWKKNYVIAVKKTEPPQHRIAFGKRDPKRGTTVSEGQGYGMLITALMAGHDSQAQKTFDGLWQFVRAHPSSIDPRLMAWEVPGPKESSNSAFDGDADIAYALLLADKQWGAGGEVKYKDEALKVIAGIKESTIGPASKLPLLGDWVAKAGTKSKYTEWTTRSSDFLYGHCRAFGRATGEAAFWDEVVKATQNAATSLQTAHAADTGLLPDFIVAKSMNPFVPKPAPAGFLESANDGSHSYNACRNPWRMGTDALLSGDATSLAQVRKMNAWVLKSTGGDATKLHAGYRLHGVAIPGSDYFSGAFVAPFGVAAMTGSSDAEQAWLNKLYNAVRVPREDYYEDSINLLCLLVMTGNFWDPTM